MSKSVADKYNELYNLLTNHEWEEFKIKLGQYYDTVDINTKDNKNNYLLTYAIMLNRLDIVDELLAVGANIDITDSDGRSIIYHAITLQYDDILDRLLEINEINIGISILHIKDKKGKVAIHYAIEFENEYAIKQLLKHNANVSVKDDEGYNGLHLSIYTRNTNIIKLVADVIPNINSRCKTGENSLHIASNLQQYNICELLIEKDVDINAQDYDHEFTALHYVVTLGNSKITELFLTNNADPNVQDVYGNTPLHYAIMEGSYACIIALCNHKYKNYVLNCNLWNIDSKLPIHLFFMDFSPSKEHYIDLLVEKSNMFFQDDTGNNCLHYMCMHNIWKKYIDILETKKLDIFSKNSIGLSPIQYIKKDDINTFIKTVVTSYINRLKTKNIEWSDSMDIICSTEFTELSSKDKKKLGNIKNAYDMENKCKEIIKTKINTTWSKIQKGELKVKDKSFPVKNTGCKIAASMGVTVNFCTYTGSTLDVLIGLIYILKKHKSACSTLNKNYANNKDLCTFYKSLGILMNNRCEFLNFEIVWVHYKLYIMSTFQDLFKKCTQSKKRFVVIPVGIELRNGSHANYIIYDKKLNEVERFEPHGSTTPPGLNYNPKLLDDILEKRFEALNMKITYVRPSEYLPKIGFQLIDATESSKKRIGDPGGFCALWSLWYTDMRLTYPDINRKKLVRHLMRSIKLNNMSFKNLIRNYSRGIVELRDDILTAADMDINDWLNDDYSEEQLNKFTTELNNRVNSVIFMGAN